MAARRRATVLLMVVSLLALLFVIITGFLSLARTSRENVVLSQKGDLTKVVIDDVENRILSEMLRQMTGDAGRPLSGPSADFQTIPGYNKAGWLSSLEPVWDAAPALPDGVHTPRGTEPNITGAGTANWQSLAELKYPALTSLEPSTFAKPERFPFSVLDLMVENDRDNGAEGLRFDHDDLRENARLGWMDADGDGVPDSSLLAMASVNEMANALAGKPVNLSGGPINPATGQRTLQVSAIPSTMPPNPDQLTMQRFLETARFAVGTRVVAHGGMIALDAPQITTMSGLQTPSNRSFAINMLDSLLLPAFGAQRMGAYSPAERNLIFNDLALSRESVEASLRRRNGLPPTNLGDLTNPRYDVPAVLAFLQGANGSYLTNRAGFAEIFSPRFDDRQSGPLQRQPWQRFNVADPRRGGGTVNDREAWSNAVGLDATTYDRNGLDLLARYDRRRLLTTTSSSDTIALKQTAGNPNPIDAAGKIDLDNTKTRGSTYEGELQFYLGEVAKAFEEFQPGQFRYVPRRNNQPVGDAIVERLARLYYDMLSSHSDNMASSTFHDWQGVAGSTSSNDKEAVSRTQQAFMLAVNTIAFAAPRDTATATRGYVDTVVYHNGIDPADPIYIGYAPQPFITELIAQRSDSDTSDEVALGIELYNPNDPGYAGAGGEDQFGLRIDQYAITVGDVVGVPGPTNPTFHVLQPAGGSPFFEGRQFRGLIVSQSNSHFESALSPRAKIQGTISENFVVGNRPAIVRLWRQGRLDRNGNPAGNALWYVVDQAVVNIPPQGDEAWSSFHRDTSPTGLFAGGDLDGDTIVDPARWRVPTNMSLEVLNPEDDADAFYDEGSGGAPTSTLGNATLLKNGTTANPDVTPLDFAPLCPLITMNAGPVADGSGNNSLFYRMNNLPMFGDTSDLRPRSFPTPGFLLFVPRFSHLSQGSPAPTHFPVGRVLGTQWLRKGYAAGPNSYPADFGHMPVFDNTQRTPFEASSGTRPESYLDTVGKLPWGLLVFDYFTTINPQAPGVDPLRVPGRIDINNAPWYVLSNLPMLGPVPVPSGGAPSPLTGQIPIRGNGTAVVAGPSRSDPYSSFWSPAVGVLCGEAKQPDPLLPIPRLLAYRGRSLETPYYNANTGRYVLGPWLAQAAASYRDGIQYLSPPASNPPPLQEQFAAYVEAHLRNGPGSMPGIPVVAAYRPAFYGRSGTGLPAGGIRGAVAPGTQHPDTKFMGFVSVGELANVKGFDSTDPGGLSRGGFDQSAFSTLGQGDFVKAVSLLALLDTHYLTTRSNTFTVYTSVIDRENPDASVHAQLTVDRGNLLPRLRYNGQGSATVPWTPLLVDQRDATGALVPDGTPETPVYVPNDARLPEIIAQRRTSYFNARFDY